MDTDGIDRMYLSMRNETFYFRYVDDTQIIGSDEAWRQCLAAPWSLCCFQNLSTPLELSQDLPETFWKVGKLSLVIMCLLTTTETEASLFIYLESFHISQMLSRGQDWQGPRQDKDKDSPILFFSDLSGFCRRPAVIHLFCCVPCMPNSECCLPIQTSTGT